MHSTTNNPHLRKNFVGNLLKKIIFMTPYWKQTVPMSGMSYTSTPPPPNNYYNTTVSAYSGNVVHPGGGSRKSRLLHLTVFFHY